MPDCVTERQRDRQKERKRERKREREKEREIGECRTRQRDKTRETEGSFTCLLRLVSDCEREDVELDRKTKHGKQKDHSPVY